MNNDMSVACSDGMLNIRAGAIIMKDGKVLMIGNKRTPYLYSVGGRIKMGETAEEAVVREVFEETGVKMQVERLGFVHENYFCGDSAHNFGKMIYEISFFFYMKVPDDFSPVCESFTDDGNEEFLIWVSPNDDVKIYPEFFRTELRKTSVGIRHIVTNQLKSKK